MSQNENTGLGELFIAAVLVLLNDPGFRHLERLPRQLSAPLIAEVWIHKLRSVGHSHNRRMKRRNCHEKNEPLDDRILGVGVERSAGTIPII